MESKAYKAEIYPLTVHTDERGYLMEVLRVDDQMFEEFGQVYLVGNHAKGTIRAFHRHFNMVDYFFISHGAAKFVLIDTDADPVKVSEYVVCSRNPSLVVVPPCVWHGWMSLEDDTQMLSIASKPYNRQKPDEERVPPDYFNHLGNFWVVKGR